MIQRFRSSNLLWVIFIALLLSHCTPDIPKVDFDALSLADKRKPENALSSMMVAEGLDLTLFASEPMIMNPTNMAIDAKGRIWICEGRNYRLFANPDNPYDEKGDRILILEDLDQDGIADTSKVFYQGEDINSALGIVVLGDKVIVSKSPNVFVFTDHDGDDIPDSKEKMFTGIEGADHDHGMHAFVFGPDGRLYFNYGNNGRQLLDRDGKPIMDIHGVEVNASGNPYREGMTYRCEIDGSNVEVLGNNFRNPYEVAVDSYCGLWQSDNDDDGNRGVRINFLMEYGNYGYRDKITGGNWRERRPNWEDEIPLRHWHLNDPGTVPNLLQTGSGSPCGIIIYEGDMLPAVFKNQMIHCEPGHNVVRSYIVENDGAGYKGRIENLITSKDDWFRPDDVTVAPDGSLFISDWYDGGVGGHKAEDVARGRVYRLATGSKYEVPTLDLRSAEGAANGLLSDNMDAFYQSWQKLHTLGQDAEPALLELIQMGGKAKARALWLAARIPQRRDHYLELALRDEHPNIRMQGIRMARYLGKDQLEQYLVMVVDDPSLQVRREAAIALKYVGTNAAAKLWAMLASQHVAGDRWYLEALGIGADQFPDLYFANWKSSLGQDWETPANLEVVWRTAAQQSVPILVELINGNKISSNELPKYFRAFHFINHPEKDKLLMTMLDIDHPERQLIQALAIGEMSKAYIDGSAQNIRKVKSILPEIEGSPEWLMVVKHLQLKDQGDALLNMIAGNGEMELRKEATGLLFHLDGGGELTRYLESGIEETTKMDIVGMMSSISDMQAITFLENSLASKQISYPLMRKIVEALGSTGRGQRRLFALLEEDKIPEEHKTTAVLRLMNSNNIAIREKAPNYLDTSGASDLDMALLLEKTGDVTEGKKVFATYCSVCHKIGQVGFDFGPGLADIGNKLSRESMYSSIIYPSAGINFGYEGFIVRLKDGSEVSGYILNQSEDAVSIKMMGATVKDISMTEIESMEPMKNSLMTEGLHQVMKEQELVDVVAYLENLKVL
jgi:putative membrane-bound dehydrogenase-like protein